MLSQEIKILKKKYIDKNAKFIIDEIAHYSHHNYEKIGMIKKINVDDNGSISYNISELEITHQNNLASFKEMLDKEIDENHMRKSKQNKYFYSKKDEVERVIQKLEEKLSISKKVFSELSDQERLDNL